MGAKRPTQSNRGMSVAERSKGLISLPLLCCVVALGCAEHPPAVIEDRSSTVEQTEPEVRRATQIAMSDRGELPTGPDYIVQPGDTLYANTEVLDKRESRSRPNAGIVSVLTRGINQDDVEVCVFERQILVPKRAAA